MIKRLKRFVNEVIFPMTSWLPRYHIVFQWGNFEPGDTVLDVGCGEGIVALKLAERCQHVTGVDISTETLRLAGERQRRARPRIAQKVDFCQGSVLGLPFQNNVFDKIIFLDALPEIKDDRQALAELARVLKPSGRLIITAATLYTSCGLFFNEQRLLRKIVPRWLYRSYLSNGRGWLEISDEEVREKLRIQQNYTLEELSQKAKPWLELCRHMHVLKRFGALATDITYGIKGFWNLRPLFFWPAVRLDYFFQKKSIGYTVVAEFKKSDSKT